MTLGAVLPLAALLSSAACTDVGSTGGTDMSPTAPPPDLTAPTRYGFVRLANLANSSAANALFVDTRQAGAGCQREAVGECVLYTCTGASFVLPTAGSIALTGGLDPITLMTRVDGSYAPVSPSKNNGPLFSAGQKLSVDAGGQLVPQFHAEAMLPTLPATSPMNTFALTNPPSSSNVFPLNRQRDYQLTWTALPAGTRIHAELNQDTGDNHGRFLKCDFDGASGQGVLPATLLKSFVLTDTMNLSHYGYLLIGPAANAAVSAGGWSVSVMAMSYGRDAFATIADN